MFVYIVQLKNRKKNQSLTPMGIVFFISPLELQIRENLYEKNPQDSIT